MKLINFFFALFIICEILPHYIPSQNLHIYLDAKTLCIPKDILCYHKGCDESKRGTVRKDDSALALDSRLNSTESLIYSM